MKKTNNPSTPTESSSTGRLSSKKKFTGTKSSSKVGATCTSSHKAVNDAKCMELNNERLQKGEYTRLYSKKLEILSPGKVLRHLYFCFRSCFNRRPLYNSSDSQPSSLRRIRNVDGPNVLSRESGRRRKRQGDAEARLMLAGFPRRARKRSSDREFAGSVVYKAKRKAYNDTSHQ